jgi:phosphatidylglycerophosphate synthase
MTGEYDVQGGPAPGSAATQVEAAAAPRASRKGRARSEFVCEAVFRPLAQMVVQALLPLRVPPPAVVLAGAAVGLAAAAEIARGELIGGALLLQLKTVLDNADGQLARASGRVSVLGRYLDTESDLVVNAAVLGAVGYVTGRPWLALAAFLSLTAVLAVDFNLERLYRAERDAWSSLPPASSGLAVVLERVYRVLYLPQDRLVERYVEARLRRLSAGREERLAYHDTGTLVVLANFGLSTQLLALGLCLLAGAPVVYLWIPVGCAVSLVPLLWRRELLARRLKTEPPPAP